MKFKALTIISALFCTLALTACASSNSTQESSNIPEISIVSDDFSIVSDDQEISEEVSIVQESSGEVNDDYNLFGIPSSPEFDDESYEPEPSEEMSEEPTPTYQNFEYQVEDDYVTITKYTGSETNVLIPVYINGIEVRVIGESAFEENMYIKSVTIPDSLTDILERAFYKCENLEEVKLSDNSRLTEIQDEAFYWTTALKEFTIPENCEYVDDAFSNTLERLYVLGKETRFCKGFLTAATTVYGYKDSQAAKQLSPLHGYKFEALD